MKYLTVSEAAARWGISGRRMQQLCKSGAVEGAKKEGRSWLVPEDMGIPFHSKAEKRPGRLPLPVGIFSGMNNLKVNTILDDRYSSYFGFSRDEVERMLDSWTVEEDGMRNPHTFFSSKDLAKKNSIIF